MNILYKQLINDYINVYTITDINISINKMH